LDERLSNKQIVDQGGVQEKRVTVTPRKAKFSKTEGTYWGHRLCARKKRDQSIYVRTQKKKKEWELPPEDRSHRVQKEGSRTPDMEVAVQWGQVIRGLVWEGNHRVFTLRHCPGELAKRVTYAIVERDRGH